MMASGGAAEPFAASAAAQGLRLTALTANEEGGVGEAGRAALLQKLEQIALQLHTEHGLEVGVVVLEPRGCVRAFGTADEVVGEDFVEAVTRAADVEPVLQHYRELTGTFDGADPGCDKCAAWRRSQSASTNELRKRTSMTELLSVRSTGDGYDTDSGDSAPTTPVQSAAKAAAAELEAAECEANAADAAAAAAVGWGPGLGRQARGLCRMVEPWLADLANEVGEGGSSDHRAEICAAFLDAVSRGEQANSDGRGLSTGLARGLRVVSEYRSANRARLLSLARELCNAIAAENAAVDAANVHVASQGEAAQRVDYAAALHRHYCGCVMPTVYDWTDHDLPDMIIAELPARKVLADGPRLTNTFVNGTAMPLFAHLQETPLTRQIEWLRAALVLIHEELARGFALWSAENPNSKLPRVSLVQNTELSETLINTKVDMMQDLVEQEGLADDSDTSLEDHPRLLQDVDMYILKCISQYGDNQFYGKFKKLYPDTADIVTQIPSAGRSRRITIGPRPPPELDPSPRTVIGSGRPAVISDFVEVSIERTFVAKLCYVAEDLFPVGTMQLRLLQYVDATGNQFTTRGLVEVSAPIADDGISEEARQAVLRFGSPTVATGHGHDSKQSRQHDL